MRKHNIFWLILLSSVMLTLITACGASSTATNATTQVHQKPITLSGESLYVLDGYGTGSTDQHIIAFHPGNSGDTTQITLPVGLFSQDHKYIYTATPQKGQTRITTTDTLTGTTVHTFSIPGSYTTSGQNYTTSVLSGDGKWLALREMNQPVTSTTIALIDTQAGKLAKTIHLKGYFDLDAVAPEALRLYLLERLDGPGSHYHVRYYDMQSNALYEQTIIDKQDLEANMFGDALTRQMSSDGTVAYTLYTQPHSNIAFVHILSLTGEFFDSRCLDLPTGKSADLLRYYTLTRSADGSRLYAVNAALGTITAINIKSHDVPDNHIQATMHFTPGILNITNSDTTRMLYNGAALSLDQKTLYVVGVRGIWAFNTSDLHIQNYYLAQQAFTSIAMSANRQTLYATYPTSGILMFDPASGQAQQIKNSPAHTPWGIEWVAN
jgi:hypothetical protein